MTYGSNPNGMPLGSVGHTNIPLPATQVIKVKPAPVPVRKDVADGGTDDTSFDSENANYPTTEPPSGNSIWDKIAGTAPPSESVPISQLIEGNESQGDVIYGSDDDDADDIINGPDDFGDGEMSDEEMNNIIEGDADEMDRVINGEDPEEMSDSTFDQIVYGDPDPKPTKPIARRIYRVSGSKLKGGVQRPTNTGLGMMQ